MRTFLVVLLGLSLFSGIICPPVQTQPEEGGGDTDDEDTGLEYDRYLKEIIMALEEDPSFRKKLEEANVTDIKKFCESPSKFYEYRTQDSHVDLSPMHYDRIVSSNMKDFFYQQLALPFMRRPVDM